MTQKTIMCWNCQLPSMIFPIFKLYYSFIHVSGTFLSSNYYFYLYYSTVLLENLVLKEPTEFLHCSKIPSPQTYLSVCGIREKKSMCYKAQYPGFKEIQPGKSLRRNHVGNSLSRSTSRISKSTWTLPYPRKKAITKDLDSSFIQFFSDEWWIKLVVKSYGFLYVP